MSGKCDKEQVTKGALKETMQHKYRKQFLVYHGILEVINRLPAEPRLTPNQNGSGLIRDPSDTGRGEPDWEQRWDDLKVEIKKIYANTETTVARHVLEGVQLAMMKLEKKP